MELTHTERNLAYEFAKGLTDGEVADNLCKSIWTIRAQKKGIYRKLGITKETELMLWALCDKLKKDFDIKELHKHGLELLFSMLFIVMQITCHSVDMRAMRTPRPTNTTRVTRRAE